MNDKWKPVEPWIRRVLARHGWTPTDWCKLAGISPSTLLRPLNNPHYAQAPSLATLQALAAVTPEPLAHALLAGPPPRTSVRARRPVPPVPPTLRAHETGDAHVFTFEIRIPK